MSIELEHLARGIFRLAVQLACALVLGIGPAFAQNYPDKPIRFISPFAPGGSTSILARVIGQKLTENWRQQVFVDNRPGGNTVIGTEATAKSAPDGYTIMVMTSSHVITPLLLRAPYDPIRDFCAVGTVTKVEVILVVHPSVPAHNLQEVIALARSKPGQLNYASVGSGGPSHLAAESFNIMLGIKLQHIPYKGGSQAVTDLIGGQVELFFGNPINVVTHIKSGRLRGIAVSGENRLSALPQVLTFTEGGVPGFEVAFWQGILAPAGTPKEIVDKLAGEIAKILSMSDVREKIVAQGAEPFISTPEQFASLMKADMAKYAKVIKAANIKAEE